MDTKFYIAFTPVVILATCGLCHVIDVATRFII